MRRDYIPSRDGNQLKWAINFAEKLPLHAANLGVLPEEVEEVKADVAVFSYTSATRELISTTNQHWTTFAALFKSGSGVNDIPRPPIVAEPPPSVPAGYEERTRKLVARIKKHRGYTEAIGRSLGLVGQVTNTIQHLEQLQPNLTVALESGQPVLTWKKNGSDALVLECDRGTGVFERIEVSLETRYADPAPLPQGKSGVLWNYRGTYRSKDKLIGKTSAVVSIGVFGQSEAAA